MWETRGGNHQLQIEIQAGSSQVNDEGYLILLIPDNVKGSTNSNIYSVFS